MAKSSLKKQVFLGVVAGLALTAQATTEAADYQGFSFFLAAGCNGPNGCHAGATNPAPSGVDQDEQGYYQPHASSTAPKISVPNNK